jgi:hypothetical protein
MKRAMLIIMSMALMTDQVSAYYICGEGAGTSCGAWVEARRARNVGAIQLQAWVTGYMSAANSITAASSQNDFLAAVDTDAIFVWLDNRCQQHPLEGLIKAIDALISDLMKKAGATGAKTK